MLLALVLVGATAAWGIPDPSLKWKTFSTEHFDVHFHEGAAYTAQRVAEIAEEVYPHITGLYGYEPGRVNFVIRDSEDYANGAAYYYDNKVEIWATNLEFGFRGTHDWLRNVVTHEFTHIVSIQAAMKGPRAIPAIYLQAIGFEREKRPDVLTGYPNVIATYPLVGSTVPPWFAEGVAQYQSPTKQYDCWDTHRDMVLRAAVVDDKMLEYVPMGCLCHTSLKNEQVYDHGYGMVRYIAETYGAQKIPEIAANLGKFSNLTMDGAMKDALGKSGDEIYAEWQAALADRYDRQLRNVRNNQRAGEILADDGFKTHAPSFSPDGARVALLSNKGSDYAGTALYLMDADGGELDIVKPGVSSRPAFSPDGKWLAYARHRKVNIYGAKRRDIHVYDIANKKETRLTKNKRASDPSFSPDGRQILFVVNGDGTHAIHVMDADGSNERELYASQLGTQFYEPQFSPDGQQILFGIFEGGSRDIAMIDANGSNFRFVVRTDSDERDARFTPDGKSVVFSSDRTGIFNVYRHDLSTERFEQLTNVIGGAFAPDVSAASGALVYAGYNGDGYHVASIDEPAQPVETLDRVAFASRADNDFYNCERLRARPADRGLALASTDASSGVLDMDATGETLAQGSGNGAGGVKYPTRKYKPTYTDFQLYPRAVLYDGDFRAGAFLASNEILDYQTFFVGASYGLNGEFDAFVDFEVRRLFPVLFVNFILLREKFEDNPNIDGTQFFLDTTYDLWAIDAGFRLEFVEPFLVSAAHDLTVWYSRSEYKVFIDPEFLDDDGIRRPENPVGWKYFKGNEVSLRYRIKAIANATDSDINPRGGRAITLGATLAFDELFSSGEFAYAFRPVFDDNKFGKYQLEWTEYLALPWARHSLVLEGVGSVIDAQVDDFFYNYIGGLDGVRGYSFYSIGGLKGAWGRATYRFPLMRHINKQIAHLKLSNAYAGVFYEGGNAWDEDEFKTTGYKKAVGGELRVSGRSFYNYPTTINVIGSYGINEVIYEDPVFTTEPITQGKEWRWYFSLGFGF